MNKLSKIFTLKNTAEHQQNTTASDEQQTDDEQSYYHKGYLASGEAKGNSVIFKSCLEDIYEKFKQKCRHDEQEQQRLNTPYIAQRENLKSTLKARETLKKVKEETLDDINTNINQINNNISKVKKDPDEFGLDVTKKPRAQFFIGLIILLPITLYLLVFYISASYSAFFKSFDSSQVIAAIFDANALSKAINDGWLEAIFVCTIPFTFLGLGFLIHMFQKEKRTGKFKILALFIITFIFDSILAYLIEKKIYDFDKTLTSLPFDLKIAFSSIEFWGIIFAGFVVYIIWGLVFDFVMKEYDNIDKIKVFINKLKEDKKHLLKQKEEITEFIRDLRQEITKINGNISELQSKIDGFIFPNRKYLLYHARYTTGWYMAINSEQSINTNEKDILLKKCEEVSMNHLIKHGVSDENNEYLIYNVNSTDS